MKIQYYNFGGMQPAIDPHRLPKMTAQVAENCDLSFKTLKPWPEPDDTALAAATFQELGRIAAAGNPTQSTQHLVDLRYPSGTPGFYQVQERGTKVAPSTILDDAHERVYFTRPDGGLYVNGRTDAAGALTERSVGVPAPGAAYGILGQTVSGRTLAQAGFAPQWKYQREHQVSGAVVDTGNISDITARLVNGLAEVRLEYTYDVLITDAAHPNYGHPDTNFIMFAEYYSEGGKYIGRIYPDLSGFVLDSDVFIGGAEAKADQTVDASQNVVTIRFDQAADDYAKYRAYAVSYVTDRGEEGPPGTPTDVITLLPSQKVTLTLDGSDAPAEVTHARIYRTETSEAGTAFYFVAEVSIGAADYKDITHSIDLDGDTLATSTYDPPPADLNGLVLSTKGFYAGYSGSRLYLSEPHLAYAWPEGYIIDFTGDILHIALYGDMIAVFTTDEISLVVGHTPMQARKVRVEGFELCTSPLSTVELGDALYFSAPTGIAALGGTSVSLISDQVFSPAYWRDVMKPETIQMVGFENALYMLPDEGTSVYRMALGSGGGGLVELTTPDNTRDLSISRHYPGVIFHDSVNGPYRFEDGSTPRVMKWRSRIEMADIPMAPISVRVFANAYPVTFRLYKGDVVDPSVVVVLSSDKIRKLPIARREREWSFEVESETEILSLEIGTSGRVR